MYEGTGTEMATRLYVGIFIFFEYPHSQLSANHNLKYIVLQKQKHEQIWFSKFWWSILKDLYFSRFEFLDVNILESKFSPGVFSYSKKEKITFGKK